MKTSKNMIIDLFKTYNEGQYPLKPWAANVIMGILEVLLVSGWLIFSFYVVFSKIFSFRWWDAVEYAGPTSSFLLAALFVVWNVLVWFIKPLRTNFNYKESLWNVIFIVWLIVDAIQMS